MSTDHPTPLAQRLVEVAASVLPLSYDRACGVPPAALRVATTEASDWMGEAQDVVAAVLREMNTDDAAAELRLLAAHRCALEDLASSIENGADHG